MSGYVLNLIKLFVAFFKIGLFNFGGGLAMIPLIQRELEKNSWMTNEEFYNVLSISQMTPGAIAMNTATFIGNTVAGLTGAVVATFALALPSIIVILVLAEILQKLENNIYKKSIFFGIKPVTAALILYAGYMIMKSTWIIKGQFSLKSVFITLLMLGIVQKKKINPIVLILCSGGIGFVLFYVL
jgi:chromate transporter